jgi:carbonic anhydrase
MNRRSLLKAMSGLLLCPVCATGAFSAEGAHWSYEGATGPANWGSIDAANSACSLGGRQSPIDIPAGKWLKQPALEFQWSKPATTIVNNGHTIQLNFSEGNFLKAGGERYALLQLHFHRPSEHRVGGKNFPMEAHFVHRHASGGLAVIGNFMEAGKPNAAFKKIVETMPVSEGEKPIDPGIDPNMLLPTDRSYYRYPGSLTTPPCSETVEWFLLAGPVSVAQADITAFAKLYPMNARPIQKRAPRGS